MSEVKAKSKGGRPSKFPEDQMPAIKKLILLGAIDQDIADAYGVTLQTVTNWKKKKPEFFASLKDWKLEADLKVEQSLFNRATGYEHKEDKIFNNNGEAMVVPTTKRYPPDSTAAIFWLKNRKPSEWREKQEIEGSGDELAEALNKLADKLPN